MFEKQEIEISGVKIKANPKVLKNNPLSDKKIYRILSIISIVGSVFIFGAGIFFAIVFTNAKFLSEFVSSNYTGTNKSNFSFNVIKISPILLCYFGGLILIFYIIITVYFSIKNKAILRYNWGLTLTSAVLSFIFVCVIEVIVSRIMYEISHIKFSRFNTAGVENFSYKPASWIAKAIGTMDLQEAADGKGKISYDNYVVIFALIITSLSAIVILISIFNLFTATKFIEADHVLKHNEKVYNRFQKTRKRTVLFFVKIGSLFLVNKNKSQDIAKTTDKKNKIGAKE